MYHSSNHSYVESLSSWRLERQLIIPAVPHRWKVSGGLAEEIRYIETHYFPTETKISLSIRQRVHSRKLEADIENEQILAVLMHMWWNSYSYTIHQALSLKKNTAPDGICRSVCPRWHCSAALENAILESMLSLQSIQILGRKVLI